MAKARWAVPITINTKSGEKVRFTATGKTKKKALANGRHFVKKNLKNIEQGFYAGGIFHPIRGSRDYDSSRAGEGRSSKAKHVRATKATRRRAGAR